MSAPGGFEADQAFQALEAEFDPPSQTINRKDVGGREASGAYPGGHPIAGLAEKPSSLSEIEKHLKEIGWLNRRAASWTAVAALLNGLATIGHLLRHLT